MNDINNEIKNLIELILCADDPGSVTNPMVGKVMNHVYNFSEDINKVSIKASGAYDMAVQAKVKANDASNTANKAADTADSAIEKAEIAGKILPLGGFVENVTVKDWEADNNSTDKGCRIVFDTSRSRLLIAIPAKAVPKVAQNGTGSDTDIATAESVDLEPDYPAVIAYDYFTDWADSLRFGTITDDNNGIIPKIDAVFRLIGSNRIYMFDEGVPVLVGSGLVTGTSEGTAYPGNSGKTLSDNVTRHIRWAEDMFDDIGIRPVDGFINPLKTPTYGVWFDGDTFRFGEIVSPDKDEYLIKDPESGEYLTPRTDRMFRCGAFLYYFNGTSFVRDVENAKEILKDEFSKYQRKLSFSDDFNLDRTLDGYTKVNLSSNALKPLFIAMWNAACGEWGCYNPETDLFELNGLTDIAYEEAVRIFTLCQGANRRPNESYYPGTSVRTNIPCGTPLAMLANIGIGIGNRVEYLNLASLKDQWGSAMALPVGITSWDMWGSRVRKIVHPITLLSSINSASTPDRNSPELEDIQVQGLSFSLPRLFKGCPNLSAASIRYMVEKAANTSPITIGVHSKVYNNIIEAAEDSLWAGILDTAAAKNISFATT